MRRPRWYARPSDDVLNPRTGRPYPRNHAVPRIAWLAQHAHTATEALVYDYLERRGRVVGNGRKLLTISRAKLARELMMPASTVRNCLRSLVAKHSLVQWDADANTARKRQRGDDGGTTSWLIPPWTEALRLRRADPSIGTVIGSAGKENCYVIGKGKRFLSQFEITAWRVDMLVAARFSQAEPMPANTAGPGAPAETPARAVETPPIAMPAADPPPERGGKPDLEPLKLAIAKVCGEASRDDAAHVWRAICREAGGVEPSPTVEAACGMVASVGENWRKIGGGKPLSPGLLAKKVRGRVAPWQADAAQREARGAKAGAFDRDQRINSLAEYLQYVSRPDLPAEDRAMYEEALALADPRELAIARALVEGAIARQAAG